MSGCTEPGCPNVYYARRWCSKHWRYHKHRQSAEWHARGQQPIHGTRKRYAKGCRCADCRNRESAWRAEWRLRTGRTTTSRVLGGTSWPTG